MTVKMFCEKRGPLQGVTTADIVRQAFGPDAQYRTDGDWEGYAGAVVRPHAEKAWDVLDLVIELHEV